MRDTEDHVIDTETRTVTVPPAGGPDAGVEHAGAAARAHADRNARDNGRSGSRRRLPVNEFSRADRLLVRVALFGDSAGRDGDRAGWWAARPPPRRASRRAARQAAPGSIRSICRSQSVAPGDYVIAIEASKGTERAETFVAIRVVGTAGSGSRSGIQRPLRPSFEPGPALSTFDP